jgi:CRISPR system Cascade subunit CasA
LQTYQGVLGAGNYGISRMNGGLASRMSLGVRPLGGPSAAFHRDVLRLIEVAGASNEWRGGLPLLWLRTWDGLSQLAFGELDELYVEICRRVRLVRSDNRVTAFVAGSKVSRVAAAALNGKTGDPWAPIKADLTASVTPTGDGFGYRQMTRLLNPQVTNRPPLAQPGPNDDAEGLAVVAAALVRGQGKTAGLHRRTVPLSRKVARALRPAEALDRMGHVAVRRAEDAGVAGRRLRHALLALVQGGPDEVRHDDLAGDKKIASWTARFDQLVDQIFFDEEFWDEVAGETAPHKTIWRERLRKLAGDVFDEAAEAAPRTDVRRIRAHAVARNVLEARMRQFVGEVGDD